jgi:DNA repair exonuclease SbcCD ATPase subunit
MSKKLLIVLVVFIIGCDSANKMTQLTKEIEGDKQELMRQKLELTSKENDIKSIKLQLEQANQELETAIKRNDTTYAKIQALESEISNLTENIGKDELIFPVYLIGRPIVVYTKPYDDAQIFIGVVQKIKHADKVILSLSQTNQLVEVPFSNIIGYRMIR